VALLLQSNNSPIAKNNIDGSAPMALPFFLQKGALRALRTLETLEPLKTLASSKNKVGRRLFYIPAHNAPSIK
jgi:hypothetical protein